MFHFCLFDSVMRINSYRPPCSHRLQMAINFTWWADCRRLCVWWRVTAVGLFNTCAIKANFEIVHSSPACVAEWLRMLTRAFVCPVDARLNWSNQKTHLLLCRWGCRDNQASHLQMPLAQHGGVHLLVASAQQPDRRRGGELRAHLFQRVWTHLLSL